MEKKRLVCANCPEVTEKLDNAVYCGKFGWLVYSELAEKDAVCKALEPD